LNTNLSINSAWISGLMKVSYDVFVWLTAKLSASLRSVSQISLGSSLLWSGNVEAWQVLLVEGSWVGANPPKTTSIYLYICFYDAYSDLGTQC
jgi:hypothetical protein